MNLSNKKKTLLFIISGLSFIIGLVFLIMPFVSQQPDGLEKVTDETMGFLKKDDFMPSLSAPLKDYTIPSLQQKFDTRRYASVIGVVIVFVVSVTVGYFLKRKRGTKGCSNSPQEK